MKQSDESNMKKGHVFERKKISEKSRGIKRGWMMAGAPHFYEKESRTTLGELGGRKSTQQ